jgi:hypothetical protein
MSALPSSQAPKLSAIPDQDVTSIAAHFPELPAALVPRDNILSTLEDMFSSGIQLLTVEGPEEIGKTTLLAQFARRHSRQAISLFIRGTSLLAHDPELVLRDLCNQIYFILNTEEIADDAQTDETLYRQLLFNLLRLARRKNMDFYFIVDGIDDLPRDAGSRGAILGLLPIGSPHIKCLIAGKTESLREHIRGRIQQKPFTLPGFALEETLAYFRELGVDRKFLEELYRICSKGVPGQMASVRRLLESGIAPETLLNDLPEKLPNLFELEWKAVDRTDESVLNLLALISQSSHSHSISDAALILRLPPEKIREFLSALSFVVSPKSNDATIDFVSERFRRFVSGRLSSRRASVRELAIACFLQTPSSNNALNLLPGYLEDAGKWDVLLDYLSPEHFTAMVERSGSLVAVENNASLGLSTALRLGRDGDLLRFGMQRAALMDFDRISTLRSEVRAWVGIGEYPNAIAVAQGAALKRDRLRLLAAIARFQKEGGFTPEPALIEQLNTLYEQTTPQELGEKAVELASDLMYSRPELGINLVERMPTVTDEESANEWAFARLSVDVALRAKQDRAGMSSISETLQQKIKDPTLKEFSTTVSVYLGNYSVSDIQNEVLKLAGPSEKLFLLRLWCVNAHEKKDSADIIEYALRLAVSTTEYTPTAKHLREIATPLPDIADSEKVSKIIAILDSQKAVIQKLGPTQDYVQLQLLIAIAEAKTSLDTASSRLQEIYIHVAGLKDLEVKASCMSRLRAVLHSIDPENNLADIPIIAMVVEEEFEKQIVDLLRTTADHLKTTRNILEVLATSLPELGLKVADALNEETRRDRAKRVLVDSALDQPFRKIPLQLLEKIVQGIADDQIREKAIERILARAEVAKENVIKTRATELVPHIKSAMRISNAGIRCRALASSVAVLSRIADPVLSVLLQEVCSSLEAAWWSKEDGIEKLDLAFGIASTLAPHMRAEAIKYLKRGQELKRDPQLDCGRRTYIATLRLAIRAFSGLFHSRLETEEEFQDVSTAIGRIPAIVSRIKIWTDMALRFCKADRKDDARKVVNERIKPLLDHLKKQNPSDWHAAIVASSPALYQAHPPTCLELLNQLSPQLRDMGLDSVADFIECQVPPGEPFETKEYRSNLDQESAIDVCSLLEFFDEDSLIYKHILVLVGSASWKHNKTPFTQEQKNDLAQRLEKVISAKLPSPRFIAHQGYSIVSRAQVLRLLRSKPRQWEDLAVEAGKIPNLSDRVLIIGCLAEALPNDQISRKTELLNDARRLIESVSSLWDKINRLRFLAGVAVDIDKNLAKVYAREALALLSKTDDPDAEPVQRKLVDLLYQVDAEGASALAASLDDDDARRIARERIKYNEFRDNVIKKEDEDIGAADADPKQMAQAAWTLLGQLNANRIQTRHTRTTRAWIRRASAMPLQLAYPVFAWVIENAISRRAKAVEAQLAIRGLFAASILSCDLIASIATRHLGAPSQHKTNLVLDHPTSILIHEGERTRAIEYLRSWLEANADSFLYICDPYFGVKDVEVFSLLLSVAPALRLVIVTSKRKQIDDQIGSDYGVAYREYWNKQFSTQDPPPTDLVIVGTQSRGDLPIHDRWWLTRGAGLRIGTSFNGLGFKKVSEISVLSKEEVDARMVETEQYIQRLKRDHLGDKLNFIFDSV